MKQRPELRLSFYGLFCPLVIALNFNDIRQLITLEDFSVASKFSFLFLYITT